MFNHSTKSSRRLKEYLYRHLLWITQIKNSAKHIIKTKYAFVNDDNFDPEEVLWSQLLIKNFFERKESSIHVLLIRFKAILNILITLTTHSPKIRDT